MKLVKKAEAFARKVHRGQKQATGKPYFNHLLDVASLLKKWKQDDEVICAGLLHDAVEDSDVSLRDIEIEFGKRVAFLVDGMSWIRDKKTRKKDWPSSYKKFAEYSKKEPSLVLIKAADMISNIPNTRVKTQRKWLIEKSYPRSKSFWIPFLKETGLEEVTLKIEKEHKKYNIKKVKSVLHDYISKKELKLIREKLKDIKNRK